MENTNNKKYGIGKLLKLFRKQNGYSIEKVCELLCEANLPVSIKTIYKWENNDSFPEFKILNMLSNIYNVSIGAFFEENVSNQSLNESEFKFISYLRKDTTYRKIIYLITKKDKEELKIGNKSIM